MNSRIQPITPELALVDAELAERARTLLPEARDCLAARPDPGPSRPRRRPPLSRPGLGIQLLVVVVLAAAVLVGFPRQPDVERTPVPDERNSLPQSRSGKEGLNVVPQSPRREIPTTPRQPSPAAGVTKPASSSGRPQGRTADIRWPPAPGASYYNLILVRGKQRIDLWPSKSAATFIRFPRGKSVATELVGYSWFAYAVFLTGRSVRYGPLLGHGRVAVARGSLKSQTRPVRD